MLRVGIFEETGGFFLRRGRTSAFEGNGEKFLFAFRWTRQGNKENTFCRRGNIKHL